MPTKNQEAVEPLLTIFFSYLSLNKDDHVCTWRRSGFGHLYLYYAVGVFKLSKITTIGFFAVVGLPIKRVTHSPAVVM